MIENDAEDDAVTTATSKGTECKESGAMHEGEGEESLSREVVDDDDHSSEEKEDDSNRSAIDESYLNLLSLRQKLTLLSSLKVTSSGTGSWPTSPQMAASGTRKQRAASDSSSKRKQRASRSLKGSPLCIEAMVDSNSSRASPPSMRLEIKDSETKWKEYLEQQHRERSASDSSRSRKATSYNDKLRAQSQKLEALEQLQRELTLQKKHSEQFQKLFRSGRYSTKLEM